MDMKNKIEKLRKAGRLTVDQVKSWKMFQGINDEQAKEIIESIRQFTIIFFDYYHTVVKPKKEPEQNENLNCAA